MNLKFTKAQMCKILEKYYKEQEGITGKVTIQGNAYDIGLDICSYRDVLVEMKISGEINLDGFTIPLEKEITVSELEMALNSFLNEFNQEVENVTFDKGFTHKSVGYGMYESTVSKAYFNGAIVKVKNKDKENRRIVK